MNSRELPFADRATIAGPIVDLQAKALKAALVETSPEGRDAYLAMSKAAEDAFLLVVPEAKAIREAASEEGRDQLLALADEMDQVAQRLRGGNEGNRDPGGQRERDDRAKGFEAGSRMARERAARL